MYMKRRFRFRVNEIYKLVKGLLEYEPRIDNWKYIGTLPCRIYRNIKRLLVKVLEEYTLGYIAETFVEIYTRLAKIQPLVIVIHTGSTVYQEYLHTWQVIRNTVEHLPEPSIIAIFATIPKTSIKESIEEIKSMIQVLRSYEPNIADNIKPYSIPNVIYSDLHRLFINILQKHTKYNIIPELIRLYNYICYVDCLAEINYFGLDANVMYKALWKEIETWCYLER